MTHASVLVAGVGNMFLGDDGFGCEAVGELLTRPLPVHVRARDFGIRSFDLVHEMGSGYRDVILLDAHSTGSPPGTLRVFLPDPDIDTDLEWPRSSHSMKAHDAIRQLLVMGLSVPRVRVVGCEPQSFGDPMVGRVGLSPPVRAAVPRAVDLVMDLLSATERVDGRA